MWDMCTAIRGGRYKGIHDAGYRMHVRKKSEAPMSDNRIGEAKSDPKLK